MFYLELLALKFNIKTFFFYTGKVTLQEFYIVLAIQLNKLVLDINKEQKIVKFLKDITSHENICMRLTLSKMFCSSRKDALICMDSWFLMVLETDNFLQLEVHML